jgi:UDP-glucuronate 4-epimerase
MNILVTGCAGFIGSHLTEALLNRGEIVVGLDNFDDYYSKEIKINNLANLKMSENFSFFEGDIRDQSFLNSLFTQFKIDSIIHLAARAGVRPSIELPQLYCDVNVVGTTNLLELANKFKVSNFVFASSSSVYGNNLDYPFKELDVVDFPISPYAATKKAGELLCYTFHHLYKFNISCLRFFTVYGPRQRPEMAISKFINKINQGLEIEVFANGESLRDYTYVLDIVNGIILSLDNSVGFNIYNIGGGKPIKLIDLIRVIENKLNKKAKIKFLESQPGDVDITYADSTKAEKFIGYKSKISIEEGVESYISWLNAK